MPVRGFCDELALADDCVPHDLPAEWREETASGNGLASGSRRVDHALSWTLWERLQPPAKECFATALRAWDESETAKAVYCEGFLRLESGLLIEHGWLELPDETVIDPTIPGATCHVTVARFSEDELRYVWGDVEFLPASQRELDEWRAGRG